MKTIKHLALALSLMISASSLAQNNKILTVGDAKMNPSKNIMQNLEASSEFSLIGKVFKAAGYDEILSKEEYTILAPTNDALKKNTKDKVDFLTNPDNINSVKDIAAYYIISGKWHAADFGRLLIGNGKKEIKTANGDVLTISRVNKDFYMTDKNGNKAKLIITNAIQSNGIIHGIDGTFSPTK